MKVGVLALQGDFSKHIQMLQSMGVEGIEVRTPRDLEECEGLIIPGGESTVIMRQIDFIHLREPLINFAKEKPIFGTCAGLIILSKQVEGVPYKTIPLLDIEIKRNAFGSQADSFHAFIELELQPNHPMTFPAYFIRAPRIVGQNKDVQILATLKGEPVLVRQKNTLGASFHPELTDNPLIHQYFINMIHTSGIYK
jgi:5'-phosphate synthase pdxT subunit